VDDRREGGRHGQRRARDELLGGPANLAFDSAGYAWLTNNVKQGQTSSSDVAIVLKPNGKPADGDADWAPTSPLRGGGLLGTGFGVVVDPLENVWFGNVG